MKKIILTLILFVICNLSFVIFPQPVYAAECPESSLTATFKELDAIKEWIDNFEINSTYELVFHIGSFDPDSKSSLNKERELDIEKLQKLTLYKKMELANAKEVRQVTGCNIGSVPPFGNLFDLKVYFDKSVVENDIVAFNAGQHTKSIKMKAKDLVKVVNPVVGEFSK